MQVEDWIKDKERNVRGLLSTLPDALWPDARWKPVAFADVSSSRRRLTH